MLDKLIDAFTSIPFNNMLGLRLISLSATEASIAFDMKAELIGNYLQGILHGGVISSVLDMTGGIAAMSTVLHKHTNKSEIELTELVGKTSTIDLHIHYVHPGKGENFITTAEILRSGYKICFVRMQLHNEESLLIASGSATYVVG